MGLALLDYRKALSHSDPCLLSTISLFFPLSFLSASLIATLFPVTWWLSSILSFFSMLRWCQVLCDNLRLMEIKGIWETREYSTIPPNISHLLWGWEKEQEVTREKKKKGSGADYWNGSVFLWAVDGVPNTRLHGSTVIFKATHSLAPMFSHLRDGIYRLASGMKLM